MREIQKGDLMADREQLIEIFEDTKRWYEEEPKLAEAVKQTAAQTKVYMEEDGPALWETLKIMRQNTTGAGTNAGNAVVQRGRSDLCRPESAGHSQQCNESGNRSAGEGI